MDNFKVLADFLPVFSDPDFKAGDFGGSFHARYDPSVAAFVMATYENGWVLKDFGWSHWSRTAEAAALMNDDGAIESATPEQLARLITLFTRQDRFVEGALLEAFEAGLILRIVARAAALEAAATASQ